MRINQFKLNPIEKNGQYVLTTAQLAQAYGVDIKVISNNFNRNKKCFKEGVHYYRLTGEALRDFKKSIHQFDEQFKQATVIYLWTERGTLLHAKSLNTEKAWEVYEFLVDNYFHTRAMIVSDSYLSVQVIEKLELLERKINTLEVEIKSLDKKVDSHEKNSKNKADDVIKTLFDMAKDVIANGFETLHNNFFK